MALSENVTVKVASLGKSTAKTNVRLYSYSDHLLLKSEASELRKGRRTELKIQWAASELLAQIPLDSLKVQDICAHLSIAQGTLYLYFPDRDRLLEVLLEGFVEYLREHLERATQHSVTSADSMRLATLTYCKLFEVNRGLMKCLLNHFETFPEARKIHQDFNRAWIETVVDAVKKRRGKSNRSKRTSDVELTRRAYALGGMVDQYLSYLYLYNDANVTATAGDTNAVVKTLTFIWSQTFRQEFDDAE